MTVQTTEPWVPTETFGIRLLLIRRELGLSVKEAAGRCGLHYATWSTWENDRKPADMVRVVTEISEKLGVDRDWLMWGKEKETPRPKPGGGAVGEGRFERPTFRVETRHLQLAA